MRALIVVLLLVGVAEARDPAQVAAFRHDHPCPATGQIAGPCPGWIVDHLVPLCWGGADAPANMQWQRAEDAAKKDVFEKEACALKRTCPR